MNSALTFNSDASDRSVATRAWTYGWAISRGTRTPLEHAGYFEVLVGRPEQTMRYVLPELNRLLLQKLVATETGPGSWLKVCAPRDTLAQVLPHHWHVHDPEFLMATDLVGSDPPVPEGYHLQTDAAGALVLTRLVADSGDVAASGQVAVDGPFATFDQIVTAETHRRRGLGRYIMTALSNIAIAVGARQGVLVATESGAALYKTMGWSLISPVAAASLPAALTT